MIEIGPARVDDFDAIAMLLERSGLPIAGLQTDLQTALVMRDDGELVGIAALEIYPSGALLRSVAVDERWRGRGLGQRLTEAALALARSRGHPAAYLLTTTAGQFFPRFGFTAIERDQVPADVRTSVEFTSACPASALVMRADLTSSSRKI